MNWRIAELGFSRSLLLYTKGIPLDLLTAVFSRLPADAKILGFGESQADGRMYMWIGSDTFKETQQGHQAPHIDVVFRKQPDGSAIVEKVDYSSALENPTTAIQVQTHQGPCVHEWEWYLGALTSDEYCKKCNIIKPQVKS